VIARVKTRTRVALHEPQVRPLPMTGSTTRPRWRTRTPSPRFRSPRSVDRPRQKREATVLDVHAGDTPPDALARDRCRWQMSWLADRRPRPPSQEQTRLPVASWPETLRLQLRGQPRHSVLAHAPRSLLIPCGNHRRRCCHGSISNAVTIRQHSAKIDVSSSSRSARTSRGTRKVPLIDSCDPRA
jgi:hypothetical protein